jgi:uncharacterized membrane protein
MSYKTLRSVEGITCLVMLAVLAVSVIFKIWYLPLIAIVLAAVMFGVLISRMKEVYVDERTMAIDEKAGKATVSIGNFSILLTGSILLAFSHDYSSGIGIAAIVLYAAVCGLNIINYLTKLYYRGKLSVKNE